jgi:hypothetical protein
VMCVRMDDGIVKVAEARNKMAAGTASADGRGPTRAQSAKPLRLARLRGRTGRQPKCGALGPSSKHNAGSQLKTPGTWSTFQSRVRRVSICEQKSNLPNGASAGERMQ